MAAPVAYSPSSNDKDNDKVTPIVSATQFHVHHETLYEYAQPAALSQQLLHLTPRDFDFQRCEAHSIVISPNPSESHTAQDYFGNHTQYLAITQSHTALRVSALSTVSLLARPGEALIARSLPWEHVRAQLRVIGQVGQVGVGSHVGQASHRDLVGKLAHSHDPREPLHYVFESPHVTLDADVAAYAAASFPAGRSVLAAALDLTQRIHDEFTFDPEATDIATPLKQLLRIKRGVCQDFAHLMIACMRVMGLPCRYMSGYILTHPAPGKPRLIGADASHAWVSVYCPSIGWVDFDPTNRCMVNLEHITLAWGRDFSDVTLLQGVMLGGGEQTLTVRVTVMPQAEWLALTLL